MNFLETIRYEMGAYHLLELHQARVNRTFSVHFPSVKPIDLAKILPDFKQLGKCKFRVKYDAESWHIDHSVYTPRNIESLKMVESDIDYDFKYADRSELNELVKHSGADEIVIVKNGLITDSSYSNLAFFDGVKWWTPKSPLLHGVRRSALLEASQITEGDISRADLNSYEKVSFINAMLDLDEISFPTQ